VTIFARRFQSRLRPRPRLLLSAFAAALCLSFAAFCSPAAALITEISGDKVGVQPREIARFTDGVTRYPGTKTGTRTSNIAAEHFENTAGNPVLHSVQTYLIFWDPQFYYHGDWMELISNFVEHEGSAGSPLTSVFAVDAGYTDSTNQPAANHFTLLGDDDDLNPYPEPSGCSDPRPFETTSPSTSPLVQGLAVCLTDAQVRTQIETVIAEHDLPKGMNTVYYLLTPPGVSVCLDGGGVGGHCSEYDSTIAEIEQDEKEKTEPVGYKSYLHSFCSYHGAIGNGNSSTILYGVLPWTAGGQADYQLPTADQSPGYDCQDGAFEPATKPDPEGLEKESSTKEKTVAEEDELAKEDEEEKNRHKEAEALGITGPHEQEPNQRVGARSEDGSFDTGLADLIVNQLSEEEQNIVTDPLLDGWHDSEDKELTDECRNFFLPKLGGSASANPETLAGTLYDQTFTGKNYYLNDAFALAGLALNHPGIPCLNGVTLEPKFTPPNPVDANEPFALNGEESDITLNWGYHFTGGSASATYPTFTWNFGDGTSVSGYAPAGPTANSPESSPCPVTWLAPCAGSVYHSYKYGGTYTVTLTVRDVAGNTASVSHQITVIGPAPPSEGSSSSGGSGSSSSASSSSSSSGSGQEAGSSPGHGPAAIPAPVATTAVLSRSLASILRNGLVVRYSVNEQVAGHFEVLLNRTIARRLGISGTLATGLPAGTPAELVIAKALLVTTKGGRNTVDIQFAKRTAQRLQRLHKVTLTLRLIVRNSSHSPATTSVLSQITLGS
jgi:hypothetical protein